MSQTRREQEQHLAGLALSIASYWRDLERDWPADVVNYIQHELQAVQAEFDALHAQLYPVSPVQEADVIETVAVQPDVKMTRRPPCPWLRTIRRFYAIAKDFGLDTEADERMRGALSMLLGRHIGSRSELDAAQWEYAGSAIKDGLLMW